MTVRDIRLQLCGMESGECRWIGRHDVHVYCRNPLVQDGPRWRRGVATYKIVTADEESPWVGLDDAAAAVAAIAGRAAA